MSDSDSNHDGPVQYSDDDEYEYDESNPDRSSVISTGARASKQYRESRMTHKNNRETLTQALNHEPNKQEHVEAFGVVPQNITELITQDAKINRIEV